MKVPHDEKELKTMCKAAAFAYGRLRSDDGTIHEWYAVCPMSSHEGFVAEFDRRGNCIYTIEFDNPARLTQYAAMLYSSKMAV